MPPWGAVKGFGNLEPDKALTQEEILIVSAWVVGGAPQGDPALLPKFEPPSMPSGTRQLSDAILVSTRVVLEKGTCVAGIRPQTNKRIESARITAQLPDGRLEPLLWLYNYEPTWNHVFRFRTPLTFPRGTLISASSGMRYYLESLSTGPAREP